MLTISSPDRELYNAIAALEPDRNPAYCDGVDISNGRLLSDVFKDVFRYNATAKSWYYYDGRVWLMDVGNMKIEQMAKRFSENLRVYAIKSNASKQYGDSVHKLGDRRRRITMIEDARDFNYILTTDLDSRPELFNCQNCVINLDTLEQIPHDSSLLLSKISNVVYKPGIQGDAFERFIKQIMCDDMELVEYMQRLLGYSLTASNDREEFYMMYGPESRNGKGTCVSVILHLMGDYAMNAEPETIVSKKKDTRTASGDLARLHGCRFLNMSEPDKKMIFDAALVKRLTGRDSITVRHLHEREFEYVPCFKLFINTNYLPIIQDDTLFKSGRVKVIPFNRHFSESERDVKLKDRLKSEDNIAAAFNWMLEGLRKYQTDGLNAPASVKNAVEAYRAQSDKIGNFIDERLEKDPKGVISASTVYSWFQEWCEDNGFGCENKSNFYGELRTKRMLCDSGTIAGVTVRNVIKGYRCNSDFVKKIS